MNHIRTLLLLALPASGKSEIRRLLAHLTPEERENLHLGKHLVQIDDYPYVEFMREIDRLMTDVFQFGPIFFQGPERRFQDPREWLTLIELLNQDYRRLCEPLNVEGADRGWALLQRIITAQHHVGAPTRLETLPEDVLGLLGNHLTANAMEIYSTIFSQQLTDDATLIVEFARGGAHDAHAPLPSPMGYEGSLSRLSPHILEHAGILYVEVTPKQARTKNFARAVPPPGQEHNTTIYHGVPLCVMLADYGCDDYDFLTHGNPRFVHLRRGETARRIPTAVFDNHGDWTTPLRAPREKWSQVDVSNVYNPLKTALDLIFNTLRQ